MSVGDAGLISHQAASRARSFGAPLLAWLFLVYTLPAILFLSIAMPPFQVTDEDSHALRADQVSLGILVSPRTGGNVDGALAAFRDLFSDLRFHYERKVAVETARAAASLEWAAPDRDTNFQNTAQYGPLLYLPQAAGIWTGKLLGLNPVWTILCARLVNGLVSAFVGFVSIRICRRGQAMVFTTLLLPMTMSQFASVSQDALVISLSIFAGALASRTIGEQRLARTWEFLLFVVIVVATTMARPSQMALAGLGIALIGWRDVLWRRKLVIALLGLVAVGWWMVTLLDLMPEQGQGGSLYGQLVAIASDPGLLPLVLYRSLQGEASWLFQTLVGVLGWLDTPLPHWYYLAAAGAMISTWLAPGNSRPYAVPAFVGLLTFGAMLLAISAALYASWTPVGKPTIDGLQGRYMLPVLPLLAWAAPVYRPDIQRLLLPTWIVVAAFPLISLSVLPEAIMTRYYGSWSGMALVLKALYTT